MHRSLLVLPLLFASAPAAAGTLGMFTWSGAGPVAGQYCVQVAEPADPNTWHDNYFCSAQDIGMRWSYAGAIPGMACTQIYEPADPHGWSDNFLCVPVGSPYGFAWTFSGPRPGEPCLQWIETVDYNGWADNYLCLLGAAAPQFPATVIIQPQPVYVQQPTVVLQAPVVVQAAPEQPVVYPMSSDEFEALVGAIGAESFSSNKLDVLRMVAGRQWFVVDQVGRLFDAYTYSSDKIEAAKLLAPRTLDKQNAFKLLDHLTYSSEKDEVRRLFQ